MSGIDLTHFPLIQGCVLSGYFKSRPGFAVILIVCASFTAAYLLNAPYAARGRAARNFPLEAA